MSLPFFDSAMIIIVLIQSKKHQFVCSTKLKTAVHNGVVAKKTMEMRR